MALFVPACLPLPLPCQTRHVPPDTPPPCALAGPPSADRAHRIGQANSVNVYFLHARGSSDDLIWCAPGPLVLQSCLPGAMHHPPP